MTELVIKQIEIMAEKQGFDDSLKFIGNKRRILVPDPDLAGVKIEFQLEEFNDENYCPIEEEDEDLIVEESIAEEEIEGLRENDVQYPGPETDDRPETVNENEYQKNSNEEQVVRRFGRERRAPGKLSYAQAIAWNDKYFSQGTRGEKVVKFADQIKEAQDLKMEMSNNILPQVKDEDKCFTNTKE